MFDISAAGIAQALHNFAVAFVPAFLGIILHEIGHGYAALRQGDPTARILGRLTLNPVPHIDPLGLLVFVLTAVTSPFVFGWAKPVPINPRNFRNPRRGMLLVSLAGPLTNILLAIAFAVLLKVLFVINPVSNTFTLFLLKTLQAGIFINLCLAFLNLLPVPPLDGSKVLAYFLPPRAAYSYLSAERYGFIILLIIIAAGLLGKILSPLVRGSATIILGALGLI